MTLVHHYSTPTTPAGVGSETIIATSVQLVDEKGFSARAALGEADIVKVIVDDPLGVYDFKGLKRWYMVETDCPAVNQLVWNGYVGHQRISRGAGSSTLFPFGRRWALDLVQENTILGFRIVTGTDGNRPTETVTARLTWLLASAYLSTVVDHGLIATSTLPMDAVDYRGQTAKDVLADLALITGFNFHARYHEASGDIQLAFFDFNSSLLDASTLRISNVPADVDYALTWPPFEDAELDRSPDSVAAGIFLPYSGGSVYDYRLATSYEFGFRDMAAPSANVKTAAKANALLARLLAQHSTQDEQITGVRLRLPSANVNDVKHGQLINAKFSHLPGYATFRPMRVVSKVFSRPDNLTQTAYDVDLDLSPQPLGQKILLAMVSSDQQAIMSTSPPNVTVGTAGPSWTLLGVATNNSVGYSGIGTVSHHQFSLWWTALPTSHLNVLYLTPSVGQNSGVSIWEISGVGDTAAIVGSAGSDTVQNNADNSFGSATVSAESVLFGGYGITILGYAWGLVTTATGLTQLIKNVDREDLPYGGVAYDQYLKVPWLFAGQTTGTGTLSLTSHIAPGPAYDAHYTDLFRAWAAATIPIVGLFSIVQYAHGNSDSGASLSVSMPGPL